MSKVYFDHLLKLDEIENFIKTKANSLDEKEELWGLVDEIVHHKALDFVLTRLDRKKHEEFIEIFHKCPHDEVLIFGYLKKNANPNIENLMKKELEKITSEIMAIFN